MNFHELESFRLSQIAMMIGIQKRLVIGDDNCSCHARFCDCGKRAVDIRDCVQCEKRRRGELIVRH